MANYITPAELKEIAGVSIEDTKNILTKISDAQTELELQLRKTFEGTENDYKLVQRALAFLTAYYIRLQKKEIDYAERMLTSYVRIVDTLKEDYRKQEEGVSHHKVWTPTITGVELD